MYIKELKLIAILVVALVATISAAACASSDPEVLTVPVSIKSSVMDPETVKVKQGDMVTLKILSDEGGEFHLHTYDIEADIPANEETDFYFVADATGRFKITYHLMGENRHGEASHGEDNSHGEIFESEAIAPGESFIFEIHKHLAGTTIPFHSHLRPALNGSINVAHKSGQTRSVAIEYTDEGVEPHEVNAAPGTVITWTNNSSVPQSVISGHHADMAMGKHQTDKHKMGEHDEGEEVQIGLLEVQPR